MKNLIIAVAVLALFAGMAVARGPIEEATMVPYAGQKSRADQVWYDDIETGAPGWTHGDDSAQTIYWHIDSYMAFSGNSWWCGDLSIDADGGYGNDWTQYLTSPYISWAGYTYPVLYYQYRNDTEPGFDFSFAEAESNGVFVPLNRGYDGLHAWGQDAYYIGNKDEPAKIRFAFYSDGAWSDADGDYLTVGGAFAVDDVELWEYVTGSMELLFQDNADDHVNLVPGVPAAAGDCWHIDSNICAAFSDPHYWSMACNDDTTSVPPNMNNWLKTPVIDISSYAVATPCTMFFVQQFFMSADYGGGWKEYGSNDGGATWIMTGNWYGDQCAYGYTTCDHFLGVIPISWTGNFGTQQVRGLWRLTTDPAGNGSSPYCNRSGITIDDTWVETYPAVPVEESSWGKIKSMYR